ncbi:hypothetical protein BDV26DRAFT_291492 [Aspergillus bertholletiae]|uniref:Hypervirulence associated protein TUDOR domain-containing protein n=1 Tax=Aspergillus bertholletiae TaxID=1226010 RepID=A0A5N7BBZ0_9EURO|nr:hypothetical protein BDV26DRAFT_291492 [Aspergillus bertholletiae]
MSTLFSRILSKETTLIEGPDLRIPVNIGTIQSVLTEARNQASRNVNASEENPRYQIANLNTGRTTSVYERNILGPAD